MTHPDQAVEIQRANVRGSHRRVFGSTLRDGYEATIRQGLDSVGVLSAISRNDRVAIKPNLTFPHFRKGVMTNPEAVEALIDVLSEKTSDIIICESDSGGYNKFVMDEVFSATGLEAIAKRRGVRLVNLSNEESRNIEVRSGFRRLKVPLPRLLLDKIDWFITMPVPKVHVNTRVSLSIKNQWGVIQDPAVRLKLHPYFGDVIAAVNRALPRPCAVLDGRYGLTRSGPMLGDSLDLNWLLVSNDLASCDYHALKLMMVDYRGVPYLRKFFEEEGISALEQAEITPDSTWPSPTKFYLERKWTDFPGLMCFHSRPLAWLGYESPAAGLLHSLLYLFRERFY